MNLVPLPFFLAAFHYCFLLETAFREFCTVHTIFTVYEDYKGQTVDIKFWPEHLLRQKRALFR
jgi:hypothetical protein